MRFVLAVSLMICVPATFCDAQELRGEVRDRASDLRIAGAVISVFDAQGAVVARVASDGFGRYRLNVTPAGKRLRVVRIGFRPVTASLPAVADTQAFDIRMDRLPTLLEPVAIVANAKCPKRDAAAAYGLLEQIRASLLNSVVAGDDPQMSVVRLRFDRIVDPKSNEVLRQTIWIDSAAKTSASFIALRAPADFVAKGFVRGDSGGGISYFAPDAEVILSGDFAGGYCFQVTKGVLGRGSEVRLEFGPAARGGNRIDITGTMTVDTVGQRLTRIDFRYTGRDRRIASENTAGWISFNELQNGVVFIDQWALWSPSLRMDTTNSGRPTPRMELHVGGGEVARAQSAGGEPYAAKLGAVRLTAKTANGAPAAVTITLDSTNYVVTTDSAGVAVMSPLLPGPYDISIIDRRLLPLGVTIPTREHFVSKRDSIIEGTFVVPTLDDYAARRCTTGSAPAPTRVGSRTAWIIGKAVDSGGVALAGAKATVTKWRGIHFDSLTPPLAAQAKDGVFALCPNNFFVGDTVEVEVSHRDRQAVAFLAVLGDSLTIIPPVALPTRKKR